MKNKYKIIVLIVITIIAVFTIKNLYRYQGDCMVPALKEGKLYFLDRISPYLRQYKIGDIVIFKHEEKDWVARIVALETDTIQITEGSIIVNGLPLQDVGIQRNWTNWKYGDYALEKPFQVPSGHVYVLSDNLSAHHDDSRVFGPVSTSMILGVVW